MKESVSRRDFVRGAAASLGAATLGTAALGLVGCDTKEPTPDPIPEWMPKAWEAEADVIIIGAGGAGLSAGITMAYEDLGSAIILEAAPEGHEGGNSRVCAQILFIPDDVRGAIAYQTTLNESYEVEPELIEAWATQLVQSVEWLNKLGANLGTVPLFSPEFPGFPGSENAKTYCVNGGMGGLGRSQAWQFLRDTADDNKVEIRFSHRVVDLVFNPATKEVVGVKTEDGRAFKAKKAVIMSCGGFENSPEYMKTYFPIGYPGTGFIGSPYNRGDGIHMAHDIGAALWHMNNFAGPYFGTRTISDSVFPGDLSKANVITYNPAFGGKDFIFLGADGKRHMNEDTFAQARHGKVKRGGVYVTSPNPSPGWCIIGPKTFAASNIYGGAGTINCWAGIFGINQADTNQNAVDKGVFVKCTNASDIARVTGIDAAAIEKTITTWNTYCDDGYDPDYHRGEPYYDTVGTHGGSAADESKPVIDAYPIERLEAPYYVFSLVGGVLNSQGGPKRNKFGQIVDTRGNGIPRLYGSGEFGTIYSYQYNGGGNFSEAISSGRFAARNAAQLSTWDEDTEE